MKLPSIGSISLALTAISLFGLSTALPATAATFYSVLDLGTFTADPRNSSSATGINDLGQVVGISDSYDPVYVPGTYNGSEVFRTAPNSAIAPATDKIDVVMGIQATSAEDINNLGQVVGDTLLSSARNSISYVSEPNGSLNNINLFQASAINDSSQIAGQGLITNLPLGDRNNHAVRIDSNDSNIFIDLGTLGGSSSNGNSINNLGQVVGSSGTASGENHAFRTAPNSVINAATDDLGTLGGSSSTAFDINDLGFVVGSSTTTSGATHAFLTDANSAIDAADDLGTLGGDFSIAYSINESGLVVGDSELADGTSHAFIYDGTDLLDLNTLITENSDFVLTSARGINESGQIAATAFFADTQTSRAFLLTPVPEPATMLGVLAFGAGASLLRKTKQKLKA
jgi:probable HAF family extracellular repeat protein